MSEILVLPLDDILVPPESDPIPEERGKLTYDRKGNMIEHVPLETQVMGSVSHYNHPQWRDTHIDVMNRVASALGEKLYPTYYFDRFYFKGQELSRHKDRGACEISVTANISHNLDYDWPIHFRMPDGKTLSYTMKPGQGVMYRGCVLEHWRDPMEGDDESYLHQIFFHYVRANGHCVQFAFDQGRG